MKTVNIRTIVEEGLKLDKEIKEKTKRLNSLKGVIKAYAVANNRKSISGYNGSVTIGREFRSELNCPITELHNDLEEMELGHEFYNIITLSITAFRDRLGNATAEKYLTKKDEAILKVSFKEGK